MLKYIEYLPINNYIPIAYNDLNNYSQSSLSSLAMHIQYTVYALYIAEIYLDCVIKVIFLKTIFVLILKINYILKYKFRKEYSNNSLN